jgi:hypothetical protein
LDKREELHSPSTTGIVAKRDENFSQHAEVFLILLQSLLKHGTHESLQRLLSPNRENIYRELSNLSKLPKLSTPVGELTEKLIEVRGRQHFVFVCALFILFLLPFAVRLQCSR